MPAEGKAVKETLKEGLKILAPKGFKSPNGAEDGKEFEILMKAHKKGPHLHLHSADGYEFHEPEGGDDGDMSEYDDESAEHVDENGQDEVSDEEGEEMSDETDGSESYPSHDDTEEEEEETISRPRKGKSTVKHAMKDVEDDDGASLMGAIKKFRSKMR